MDNRRKQMRWLLGLTALSLVPVYILIGWQSGGHGSADVTDKFWMIEAGAWGLRALVEAWALIYLFQTVYENPVHGRVLILFEIALIGLIALTVGLVIIANGDGNPISKLPNWLYWVWSFGVAAFAPLMMGSVGFAYKVHIERQQVLMPELTDLLATVNQSINDLAARLAQVEQQTVNPVDERRQRIVALHNEGLTQAQMAQREGVSIGTIRNDVKLLGLNGHTR